MSLGAMISAAREPFQGIRSCAAWRGLKIEGLMFLLSVISIDYHYYEYLYCRFPCQRTLLDYGAELGAVQLFGLVTCGNMP